MNDVLEKGRQLALTHPLPDKQLILMTDANFRAAGYAVLTEDDPNQKITSTRKTNASVAYGSKTFIRSQIKMSIHAKNFVAKNLALKKLDIYFREHQSRSSS